MNPYCATCQQEIPSKDLKAHMVTLKHLCILLPVLKVKK